MDSEHEFRAIDRTAFERTLERYRNTITPVEEGEHLDTMRYNTIPGAVQARGQDAHLDKDELVTLVTWKLYVFPPQISMPVPVRETHAVSLTVRLMACAQEARSLPSGAEGSGAAELPRGCE